MGGLAARYSSRDGVELFELDAGRKPRGLARIEASRSELEHGCGGGAYSSAQGLVERTSVEARGEEAGQQHVAGADGGDRVDSLDRRSKAPHVALFVEETEARRLLCDQHVARAEVGDRVERHHEVLVVGELLADEALGLALVRRDEERL